jgi:GntR family transcriptional regulator
MSSSSNGPPTMRTGVGASAKTPIWSTGMTLHRQLYLQLRERIVRAGWLAGQALPTEEALCAEYGVSRITVRRALADLQAQGWVDRHRGRGTFVSARVPAPVPAPTLSFVDGLRRYAATTDVRVIAVGHAAPPAHVVALLELAAQERALQAIRCRSASGIPVMLTEAWIPARLGRRITEAGLRRQPLYEILMAQGVRFGRVVQEIGAQVADPAQAEVLSIDVGSALIKLVRLIHDLEGRPVQHLTALIPAERGRVLMEIDADRINTLSTGYVVHHP